MRVVVALARILAGVQHHMPFLPDEPVSRFRLPQIKSSSGRAAVANAAVCAGEPLTRLNTRKTWAALRQWPFQEKVADLGSAQGSCVLRCWRGMNPDDMQSI